MRIEDHPILGKPQWGKRITISVDGEPIPAFEGEPIATALIAAGRRVIRYTTKRKEPRGVFCALGRCTDCVAIVDGQPNVRTCVTPARDEMVIETQIGRGHWGSSKAQGDTEGNEDGRDRDCGRGRRGSRTGSRHRSSPGSGGRYADR